MKLTKPKEEDTRLFDELLDRLYKIKPGAELWLRMNRNDNKSGIKTRTGNIDRVLMWSRTPQGHVFWYDLHRQMANKYGEDYGKR